MYIYIYFIVYRNRALLYYIITKTRMRIYRKNGREVTVSIQKFLF